MLGAWADPRIRVNVQATSPSGATPRFHMASLLPVRMSHASTGQAVKEPAIMPICMRNQ